MARDYRGRAANAGLAARCRDRSDDPQLRRPHGLRPARIRLHPQAAAARPYRPGVLPRLRDRQQRRVRHALRRFRPLPLLHALGRHRRGALAHRLLVFGDVLARALSARRAEPCRQPAASRPRAPGAPVALRRGTGSDAGAAGVRRGHDRAAEAAPHPQLRAATAAGPDRDRPGCDLSGRLGACRCGPLCSAPAVTAFVPAVPERFPRRHPARHGQPRSRRGWRVRGADGGAPQALPHLRAAPAIAGRLSSRLLPAAPRGCADRAGGG